jgi:hypothetical protein
MNSSAGYGGYYPSYEYSGAANPGDWLSSEVLDPPGWPADNDPNDVDTNSPVSSPGLYTSQNVASQNYFDRPFSQTLQPTSMTSTSSETIRALPYSQVVPSADWDSNWSQGNYQPASSYVPLSLIHDPPTQNDDESSLAEGPMYSPSSSVTFTEQTTPPVAFKGAWGTSKESTSRRHSHSRSGRHSSRIKEKEQQAPSKRPSISGSSNGHKLRSTRTGQKINYSEEEERTETTKNSKSSHNMVEKQYRTRLNGQFSTLLDTLPPDLVGAEIEGYGRDDSGGAEKKVSKAEVLVLARRHIENLERQKKGLEGTNEVLMEDMQRLKGAWVDMGGQVLP